MLATRIIPVILIDKGRLVHSEGFKHPHVIHYEAAHFIETLNRWSVDEIIVLDVNRHNSFDSDFLEYIKKISRCCFVPLTVGGYIDSLNYARQIISVGADKVCINSLFYKNPEVALSISQHFGKQSVVASLDVRKEGDEYRIYVDQGRQRLDISLDKWILHIEKNGAGELLVNSIDRDGQRNGYDLELLKQIKIYTHLPIIAVGGAETIDHMYDGFHAGADALAAANMFHYKEHVARKIKKGLRDKGITVRDEPFQKIINV